MSTQHWPGVVVSTDQVKTDNSVWPTISWDFFTLLGRLLLSKRNTNKIDSPLSLLVAPTPRFLTMALQKSLCRMQWVDSHKIQPRARPEVTEARALWSPLLFRCFFLLLFNKLGIKWTSPKVWGLLILIILLTTEGRTLSSWLNFPTISHLLSGKEINRQEWPLFPTQVPLQLAAFKWPNPLSSWMQSRDWEDPDSKSKQKPLMLQAV